MITGSLQLIFRLARRSHKLKMYKGASIHRFSVMLKIKGKAKWGFSSETSSYKTYKGRFMLHENTRHSKIYAPCKDTSV